MKVRILPNSNEECRHAHIYKVEYVQCVHEHFKQCGHERCSREVYTTNTSTLCVFYVKFYCGMYVMHTC